MNSQWKLSLPVAAALLALAGCNDGQTDPEATATATESAMTATEAAPAPVKAKATGTITALDASAGTVTIDHAAIPEAQWPAMMMGFSADPALLTNVAVGDKVAFDVEITGTNGKVTTIAKQ